MSSTSDATPRVVAAAPSASAIISHMGAADILVGVTAHCSVDRPVIGGWLTPDYDRLETLDPDIICTADALQASIRDELRDRGYTVCHLEPNTLDGVINSFETLAEAIGRPTVGSTLATRTREQLNTVRHRVASNSTVTVYAEEWADPPMAAGNWVPEAIAAAGGHHPFCDPGERSREVTQTEIEKAAPDHVVLHHCGHGTHTNAEAFHERGWDIDASVHVLDDDLLNQPSPALFEGIEILAERLHSES